jgi:hypothetical protein
MDQPYAPGRLAVLLKRRARIKRLYACCDEQVAEELKRHSRTSLTSLLSVLAQEVDHEACQGAPILDTGSLAVVWRGKHCVLGPGIAWSIMAYLLGKPNRWISYDAFRDDVWRDSLASGETIRKGVTRLRDRLCAAQLPQLAVAIYIKGQRCGYFAEGPPR